MTTYPPQAVKIQDLKKNFNFLSVMRRSTENPLVLRFKSLIQSRAKNQAYLNLGHMLRKKLPDHFTRLEFIAEGGMGLIFKACDTRHGRSVAIKTLLPSLIHDADASQAFLQECLSLQWIPEHPNIVHVHEVVQSGKILYYIMEYIEGTSLAEMLHTRKRLNVKEAVWIGTQVARALEHIHNHGLVHQDINPENILITARGVAKVLDFGAVRNLTISRSHRFSNAGSPLYASPEQLRGDVVCGKSDIYSLGVCLFLMLSGKHPYATDDFLSRMLEKPDCLKTLNPEVPDKLAAIIDHSLHPDPRYRICSSVLKGEQSIDSFLAENGLRHLLN